MKSYSITLKEFNHLAQDAETSDGSMIRVTFLPPLLFMSPADASEVHEGSEIKLLGSMLYINVTDLGQPAGNYVAFNTDRKRF